MAALEMSHIDLECGCRSSMGGGSSTAEEEEEEESVCFSDADDGSCNSQFYSTVDGDGSYDDYGFACGGSEILEESRRASSAADPSDYVLDLETGDANNNNNKACLANFDRDCRICHLSLVSSSPGSGIAIELGCSCKDDLAAAHKHCAETWFKIKGNKTCEICNSVARNVVGPNDIEAVQQGGESGSATVGAGTPSAPAPSATETRTCLNGHRFLNFLLACMVFAFVISWLFHFNIPS
ncbi:hypothetical protein ABFX02_10G024700 [Erythranthe guttata]